MTATISGGIFRLANPVVDTVQPVAFGNFREGAVVAAQALSITNDVPNDGSSESLNADANGVTGGVIAAGSFDLLGPSATNSTDITVSIGTVTAGDKSGMATIDFESDGTGSSGLGITTLASQDVAVTGAVFRQAEGDASPDPIAFGNVHQGTMVDQQLTIENIASTDGFSENLDAAVTTTGDATGAGTVTALAAGATDTSITIVLDTATAGIKAATVAADFESNGQAFGLGSNIDIADGSVQVTGTVFRLAEATIDNPLDFAFGNVHVGDTVAQAVSVSNTAVADIYSEALTAGFGSTSDPLITTNGGTVNQLVAGGTDNASMIVNVNTDNAGSVNGTATINFDSDGTGTSGLGVTALASQDLVVTATISGGIFRLANPVVDTVQPVAFGNFREGAVVAAQALS
ncbi:MAG: choice-of-anchor D domain-containing protein, partial [Gammaproteobacteria bacterium]|nr:choice-of-anchor D domain-containing protein [Gammaproteobacteria bacterium]